MLYPSPLFPSTLRSLTFHNHNHKYNLSHLISSYPFIDLHIHSIPPKLNHLLHFILGQTCRTLQVQHGWVRNWAMFGVPWTWDGCELTGHDVMVVWCMIFTHLFLTRSDWIDLHQNVSSHIKLHQTESRQDRQIELIFWFRQAIFLDA